MSTTKVAGVEVSTDHFIDGKRVAAKRTFEVCSPIDGKHLADISAGGAAEIDEAVAAARRAFPKWASLGPDGRHRVLKKFAQAILDHAKELATVETADNGSLLMGNLARVIPRAAHNIEFFADRALTLDRKSVV
jgi:acyl-CoA reductase-like NAD-dependent aldehyde dehydrogenase